MKTCSKCGKAKSQDQFSPYRKSADGLFSWCRQCNADAMRERYADYKEEHGEGPPHRRKPETLKAQRSRYYARHKDKIRAAQGGRAHGISAEEYMERRSCSCEICGVHADEPGKRGSGMHIDHDHKTGVIRGTLCARCNRGVGMFDDDPAKLAAAVAYLSR